MLYRIVKTKSLLAGGVFFIAVFVFGVLWALGRFDGLADAFIFKNSFN